jgi:multidrug efflux system membrane fusion protein
MHGATLIPQAAIQRGAPGTYVYLVNADQTVSVQKVTLGPGDPTNIAITQGLQPGAIVVVDGADKLKDGAKVLLRQPAGAAGPAKAKGQQGQGQGGHRHKPSSSDQSGS